MVSKTVICLVLFAMVAVCHCMPTSENLRRSSKKEQRNDCSDSSSDSNSDSNSNENQQPCDLIQNNKNNKGKGLKMQDTSASEEWGKKMNIRISGEDRNSMEIRKAPEHQRMLEGRTGPDYAHGYQARKNIQKSRGNQNQDGNSNENDENQSQVQRNQINRQQKW